ncbi:hypothetical protein [Halorubrum sp. FL23]|uniref:hypothetical protein n=1 Tax=Halorubrum sp. FL23 TaxID=3458704 RepID=UPI004033CC1A
MMIRSLDPRDATVNGLGRRGDASEPTRCQPPHALRGDRAPASGVEISRPGSNATTGIPERSGEPTLDTATTTDE